MFSKIALIKERKDSLYLLRYLNLKDHFYKEHRQTMNKLIATVSFKGTITNSLFEFGLLPHHKVLHLNNIFQSYYVHEQQYLLIHL